MSENVTVEVEESQASSPVSSSTMTETQAKENGLSVDEVVAGKKHGLIVEDKPAKKAINKDEDFPEDESEEEDTEDAEQAEDIKPKDAAEEDLDPEEEQKLIKAYNDNEKSLYWKAKKERLKRQDAQRESEHTKIKLAATQRELDALKKGSKKDDDSEEEENVEDDDERVMTVGEYKKMLAKQKEEREGQNVKAQETLNRLEKQEAQFKIDNEDFDQVADLAREMMDEYPAFAEEMLRAAADPTKNACEVVYRIGRLNPKYRKGGSKTVDEGGIESKSKIDKAIKNADKRQSSAAVTGGGTKKIVSEDDLTVEDASKLSQSDYSRLSKKTRDRLLRDSCA